MPRRKRDIVPKGPSPAEARTKVYEAGDIFGLFGLICESDSLELDVRLEFRRLHDLLRRRSQESPLGLSRQILASGASAIMYAIVRL